MDENTEIEIMENAFVNHEAPVELPSKETVEAEDVIDAEAIMSQLRALYPDADEAAEGILGYVSGKTKLTAEEAYRVINFDRLLEAAAKQAAAEAQSALIGHIRLCGVRPAENGTDRKNGGRRQAPVSRLSRADRAKIAARAGRGERIEF